MSRDPVMLVVYAAIVVWAAYVLYLFWRSTR